MADGMSLTAKVTVRQLSMTSPVTLLVTVTVRTEASGLFESSCIGRDTIAGVVAAMTRKSMLSSSWTIGLCGLVLGMAGWLLLPVVVMMPDFAASAAVAALFAAI